MPFYSANSGPKPTKYLFIDGPFFEGVISDFLRPFELEENPEVQYKQVSNRYHRSIYYDALPVKKPNQSQEGFEKIFNAKREFLNKLRSLPNFHVRDGYTRNRPKANNRIEQKGVDTWIAVDALQYALRGIIDFAEIITSDLDLYPLFEALTQTNTRGILKYDPRRTAQELIYAADQAVPFKQSELFSWLPYTFRQEFNVKNNSKNWKGSETVFEQNCMYGNCEVRYDKQTGYYESKFATLGNTYHSKKLFVLIRHLNESHNLDLEYNKEYEF